MCASDDLKPAETAWGIERSIEGGVSCHFGTLNERRLTGANAIARVERRSSCLPSRLTVDSGEALPDAALAGAGLIYIHGYMV
jgi:hypothetical protein